MARRENRTSVKSCPQVSTAITWHLEGRRTGSFSAALGLLALSPPALLSPFPARDFATRFLGWPLGLFFTLKSSSINCQSHNGAVISTLPCQGPCLSGGIVPPSSQRLVGPSPLAGSLPCPHPSLELQRGADSLSFSATCLLPPHRTPVQIHPQQPILTCLPVLAREFLLPAKFVSSSSWGSWLPGPVSYVSLLPFEQRVTVVSIFYPTLFSK